MKTWMVEIYPRTSYCIDVEAETQEEAIKIAKSDYDDYEPYNKEWWEPEIHDIIEKVI